MVRGNQIVDLLHNVFSSASSPGVAENAMLTEVAPKWATPTCEYRGKRSSFNPGRPVIFVIWQEVTSRESNAIKIRYEGTLRVVDYAPVVFIGNAVYACQTIPLGEFQQSLLSLPTYDYVN